MICWRLTLTRDREVVHNSIWEWAYCMICFVEANPYQGYDKIYVSLSSVVNRFKNECTIWSGWCVEANPYQGYDKMSVSLSSTINRFENECTIWSGWCVDSNSVKLPCWNAGEQIMGLYVSLVYPGSRIVFPHWSQYCSQWSHLCMWKWRLSRSQYWSHNCRALWQILTEWFHMR